MKKRGKVVTFGTIALALATAILFSPAGSAHAHDGIIKDSITPGDAKASTTL
ncbi:hypothetical protein [Alkalihalobacillus sp. AL-G]|uniref:hypothetical protein n=1 Tax=Alkalihalobacillus sp. AL-G TaxID=2926399 RepID=UPI00272D88C1|nr:hypothetical protein [Alkalihalobacillus sp. AL-G]WLD92946.1 hypothetical protein MOJ78_18375 [Alkalihalobacillus sp. AL-G]